MLQIVKINFLSVCLSCLIAECLPNVLEHFENLLWLSSARRAALEDQLRLYMFDREAEELQIWLTSKKILAESKDCGQDLEDVEVRNKVMHSDFTLLLGFLFNLCYGASKRHTCLLVDHVHLSIMCRSCRRSWRLWCQRFQVWAGADLQQYNSWAENSSRMTRPGGGTTLSAGCGRSLRAPSGPENRYDAAVSGSKVAMNANDLTPYSHRVCRLLGQFTSSTTMWMS